MEAAARVPVCTPNRAERIVAFLCSKARSIAAVGISAFQVSEVLRFRERPGAAELFEAVAASIPPGDGQVIVTERTMCVVCSKGVLVMPAGSKGKDLGASPQLFTQDGPVESCRLLWKQCSHCKAKHYYSYACDGDLLEGDLHIYPGWSEARYCHTTDHQVFETKLLLRYREQCLHSHSSANGFAREYDALSHAFGHGGLRGGPRLFMKTFLHMWRCFEFAITCHRGSTACSLN